MDPESLSDLYNNDMGGVIIYETSNSTFLTVLNITFASIGTGISVIALGLMFISALLFAEWRKNYKNQLLVQFMVANYFYTVIRNIFDLRISFIDERPDGLIYYDFFLRFYTETALVAWMFVFTKHMYNGLVKVFNVENYSIWKVSLCAWFIPVLISVLMYVLFVFLPGNEVLIFILYLAVLKWPVLVVNAFLLIFSISSILKTNKSKTESNIRIVVVMIILVFAFCFQQLIVDVYKAFITFAFYELNTMPYFVDAGVVTLNVLAIYYCAFSILFWLFGNAHTRKMWKALFKRRHKNKIPVTQKNSTKSNTTHLSL